MVQLARLSATLTQLEYLVAVDRFRHFGKAAEACHVSQPTLSMQIQKLEEAYGVVFFDRDKKPIIPTDEGEKLISMAKVIVREAQNFEHAAKSRETESEGHFVLGVIPTVAPYLLPRFLNRFALEHPKIELTIQELTTSQILQALDRDQLDAGILATPVEDPAGSSESFFEIPLYRERFWVYAHPEHPWAKAGSIGPKELQAPESKNVWLLAQGHCMRGQTLQICGTKKQTGVFKNIHFESGSLETLVRMVERGGGYTVLPEWALESLIGDLTVSKTSPTKGVLKEFARPVPSRMIGLLQSREKQKRSMTQSLVEAIRKAMGGQTALPDAKKGRSHESFRIMAVRPHR